MRGITDAGCLVDIHAHVAGRGDQWLTGVQAHADPHRCGLYPHLGVKTLLGFRSTLNCIQGPGEYREESITPAVHFTAIPFLDRRTQDLVMFFQDGGVLLAQCLEQAGRFFDICE